MSEAIPVRSSGHWTRDYVGMSSENICEKQMRRKSKVSWGRLIHLGLVVPKPRPIGVGDGQNVNIHLLTNWRYHSCVTQEGQVCEVLDVLVFVSGRI